MARVHPVVSLLAGVVTFGTAHAAEAPVLRLSLAPGSTHRYLMTIDQSMEMALGPMGTQRGKSTIRMDLHQTVKERTASGSLVTEMVYDRVRMEMAMPGAESSMTFDTEGDAPKEGPGAIFGKMIGRPVALTLSPRGELVSVQGFEAMFADAFVLPEDADPQMRAFMEQMKASFGPDFIKAMMQQSQPVFPEEPLAPGRKWSQRIEMTNAFMGTMTNTMGFAFQAIEARGDRRVAKVGMTSTMAFTGEAPLKKQLEEMMRASAPDLRFDWKMIPGEGTGMAWFDLATGKTLRLEYQQPLAASFDVSGIPQQEGQDTPTSFHFDMKVDVKTTLEALD